MDKGELEKLSIEHIRIYESFEKKEKCALCRCIEDFENQVLNAISTDLVMDLEFFPKFGEIRNGNNAKKTYYIRNKKNGKWTN